MKKRLSPNLISMTLEACACAYWRKKNLALFLKQHDVPSQYTISAYDGTKRELLDDLFNYLADINNANGHAAILSIAQSLSTMTEFPDLLHLENTTDLLNKAQRAIGKLKIEINKINVQLGDAAKAEDSLKKNEDQLKTLQTSQAHFEKLKNEINSLCARLGEQKAGYEFETWFYELACFYEIETRKPYRDKNKGQIDGSITLEGTTFLIETKFTKEPINSNDIDTFRAKILRKADNTMGIMVSIAGYNENAIQVASYGRTPLLLLDYNHIFYLILNQIMSLPDVIGRVKRHASQSGESYLKVEEFSK